ncbi:MAG: Nif11 family protein [Okeania sp. SIO2C2]|uniref:Nif11-like leader peptide family natural product precursor n=1 Tax=Okeania sp. SIO2C2 TaxID=2607787 RepID=UPI0013BAB091|nr:Nif11-like leader peptide family natural product precursor [Okeania sp. SIO2C2]NEP87774.1 Nif11 family protein [Okeania sp. SIO2C2]
MQRLESFTAHKLRNLVKVFFSMSKQQLMDFIVAVKKDESLKAQLKDAQPEEILRIAHLLSLGYTRKI